MSTVGDVIYVYDDRRGRRRHREEAAALEAAPGQEEFSPEALAGAARELKAAGELGAEPVLEPAGEAVAEADLVEEQPESEFEPEPEPEPVLTWQLGSWGRTPDPAVTRPTVPIRRAPADSSRVLGENPRGARILSHDSTGFLSAPEGYALEFGTGRLVPVRPAKGPK
jgi:hypothetical protein